jgi:uncharacterized membrane protein YdjX (TVP38/TMEM64 family)
VSPGCWNGGVTTTMVANTRDDAGGQPPLRDRPAAARRWRWLPLAAVAVIAVAAVASGATDRLSLGAILAHRAALVDAVAAHRALAYTLFVLVYAAAVALSLPVGLALTLAGGFLFGPLAGGLAAVVAATAGATALFVMARGAAGEALRRRAGPRLACFADGFRRDAFNYLLFLRLVPVAPFWLVNLVPALCGVPTGVFVAATALGIVPATFTFATIGSGLDGVIAAQEAANAGCVGDGCALRLDPGALLSPHLIAGLSALGALSLVPVALRHWRRRKAPTP